MEKNNITTVTRRKITDQLIVGKYDYSGRLDEANFWGRLKDLSQLPSRDYRFKDAYGDIWQHRVMNLTDWPDDWFLSDSRTNILHCPDDDFLAFLCITVHPAVRPDAEEAQELVSLYNKALAADGYELIETDQISGLPVFEGVRGVDGNGALQAQKKAITKYLDSEYIQQRLQLMHATVQTQTDVAIGLAKELLETTCYSILHQQSKAIDKDWTVNKLLKETINTLDLTPKDADEPQKAAASMKVVLSGLNTAVQGIAELRNSYGSGHGKSSDFKGLEPKYAKFVVSIAGEISLLLLASNQAAVELIENKPHPEATAIAIETEELEDRPF